MTDLHCAWTSSEGASVEVLKGVSFDAAFGELVMVVGPVGAGKSTLFMNLLGELRPTAGTIRSGEHPMLLAPQQPIVFSGTVRENIVWGRRFDPVWYKKTVEACQIVPDLHSLDAGDGAMIGERGVSLSGGQKARISLARTVYAACTLGRPCILLLDDPFSAVDAKVGRALFNEVVQGLLKPHACIVVTHHVQYTSVATRVVGIAESGHQLTDADIGALVSAHLQRDAEHATPEDEGEDAVGDVIEATAALPEEGKAWQTGRRSIAIIAEETRQEGSVSFRSVASYFGASGSWPLIGTTALLMFTSQLIQVLMDYYLSQWADRSEQEQDDERDWRVRDYACLMAGFTVALFTRSLLYMNLAIRSSKRLHDRAFRGMMGTSLRFFDTQPVGRILNRFAKDVGYIDDLLPDTGIDVVQLGLLSTAVVLTISVLDPFVLLMASPCIIAFFWVRAFYVKTSRDVKRVEGTERSPLYAHLSVTVEGLPLLRCFPDALAQNLSQFENYQNRHTEAWITFIFTSRWLGARLDLIICLLVIVTSFSAVAQRDTLDPGAVGLSLAYIMQLTGVFQWAVRQSAEMENQLTSVERLTEYAALDAELDRVGCKGVGGCEGVDRAPLAEWKPGKGGVEIEHLDLWYDTPDIRRLKDVTLAIPGGSRVGVVGRTGAGKSSLIAALLRLAPTRGTVRIDGVPTCALPLDVLRRAINLIPQDPALFAGSVRKNLDPFDESDDAALWSALESAQLTRCIEALGGLTAEVTEFGSNFSVGERQLICLARAVLRPTSLLILDEATANVDSATDATIQSVIRQRFADCTVITIAHRLDTVIDSDAILVMDDGKVLEYGPPQELLASASDAEGSFKALYAASKKAH